MPSRGIKFLMSPRIIHWLIGRSPYRKTLYRLGILALLATLVFGLWLRPVIVRGHSMEPTLHDGAWRIGTRWWMDAQRRPARGELVVIRRAGGKMFYLKRVLGLPNEVISFERGRLLINDETRPEPYHLTPSEWSMPAIILGPDEYFVAGDNRTMPMAEHAAGRVERHYLAGRIWR